MDALLGLRGLGQHQREVAELEGILRHIYRKDSHASRLSVQKSFARMKRLPLISSDGR